MAGAEQSSEHQRTINTTGILLVNHLKTFIILEPPIPDGLIILDFWRLLPHQLKPCVIKKRMLCY